MMTQLIESNPVYKMDNEMHWFAVRSTYGRQTLGAEYLKDKLHEVFVCPIPNIFFVFDYFEKIKQYVYDNVHTETKYLRFYYNELHDGTKTPLVVPAKQMESLKIMYGSDSKDVLMVPDGVKKFCNGERVKIIQGKFRGIEGTIARWHGQQRVAIVIDGLCTIATAYVPTSFVEKI